MNKRTAKIFYVEHFGMMDDSVYYNGTLRKLDVYEKNEPAIRLYQKCGFQYIDTVDLGYGKYG